jgi:hypothetical protein
MLFLAQNDVRVLVMGGAGGRGCHSGCFAELGRTGSEVQFELAVAKNANQLFKDVLRMAWVVGWGSM